MATDYPTKGWWMIGTVARESGAVLVVEKEGSGTAKG